MTKQDRHFWIEATILLLLLASVVTAFAISLSEPLNKDDLKIAAGDLRSFAASGRLLAIQYSNGLTTETFFRNQTELIQEKAKASADSLRGSKAEPDMHAHLSKAATLAQEITNALTESENTNDPAMEAAKLDSLTQQVSQEEDALKQ